MGSNNLIFALWTKRLFLWSSIAGVTGFLASTDAQAQSVRAKIIQPAAYRLATDQTPIPQGGAESAYRSPAYFPGAGIDPALQMHRPGLIRQGRMVSAKIRRQEKIIDAKFDDTKPAQKVQDPFGEKQQTPKPPLNQFRPIVPQTNKETKGSAQNQGGLPQDVFKDPFKNENRPQLNNPKSVLPAEPNENAQPDGPEQTPPPEIEQPSARRRKSKLDSDIDYQSRRGYDSMPSRSNVYQAPDSQPVPAYPEVVEEGIYFVPAYEPIPGLQSPNVAPPLALYPDQYSPAPPSYHQPVPQNPPPPIYADQWAGRSHQTPPAVYSNVVAPVERYKGQGPVASVRRGLLEKIKSDLHRNWGVGDFDQCACPNSGHGPAFYFGFQGAGIATLDIGSDNNGELVTDGGTAFMFSLGRINGNNLRTEAELSFRSSDVNSFLSSGDEFEYSGQLQAFSGMANAYWEFTSFPSERIKPYVGAGVGFTSLTTTLEDSDGSSLLSTEKNSDSSFAYQWMAGLNYKVNNNLDLFSEYRFLDMDRFQIRSTQSTLTGDYGYSASSIGLGLRWKF